ncbi:HPr kinase/phosphorylase (plasmid) [Sulfitobacter indolifex]|uniref:HPr kinase n=1 Tax=Sulfitobacter indolifex HEL-45 TaxID=391624 RepID=A0ABP2D5G7_9RHOB|nr:hypothetical protein [Sulfitobacter indolifex]EDQ03429.1 hypothetical protein OIHEL45_16971 [Sulfitobacter indolifex HEL-45]UOA21227.1 HPr kinase/phosphorylase [Sulfitobacter indolifex]
MTLPKIYRAFNLIIQSDFILDGLEEVEAESSEIDLHVKRSTGIVRDATPQIDPQFNIVPGEQYMHWYHIGAYLLDDDHNVLVETHEGTPDHSVAQALLGIVMSIVLERRQVLCLHASAVNVNGQAALFLGDKGAGKSTTSAALLHRGHLPVTDDLVAVDPAGDALTIRPGFSVMKLWPDSIAALSLKKEDEDRLIHPSSTKVMKRMPVKIPSVNVPMGAAFTLSRSPDVSEVSAERLPSHEALQQILRYTFMARYGETRLGPEHLKGHMQRCAAIVSKIAVYDLKIPEDLSQLDRLSEEIETQIAKTAA